MPSLRAAVGALLAATEQKGSGLENLRVMYPHGYLLLPNTPGELTEGAPFEIAVRANMVPPPGPVFRPSLNFVWDVYRNVLENHRLFPASVDGDTAAHAGQFAAAITQFGDGLLTLTDFAYWPVDLLPRDLSADSAWTPLRLGGTQITELSAQVPPHVSDWLSQFNLLDELGTDLVDAISLEITNVSVMRSWLNPDVFRWPFWDLDGDVLSDGKDPAVGQLPGYITAFLAARRLVVRLGPAELPPVGPGIAFRAAPGLVAQPLRPATATDALIAMSAAGRPTRLTDELTTLDSAQQVAAMVKNAEQTAPEGGYLHFHVPISFDTSLALPAAQARLAAAQAVRKNIEAQGNATVEVRDHRGPVVVKTTQTGFDLKPGLRAKLAAAQEQERLQADQFAVLTQLGSNAPDPNPYVMSIGCSVVPASPHRAPSP
jgi:hypothetical protein